jgi:endonuclease/exonuclease/phosphatase family metal-dependent hydrolase
MKNYILTLSLFLTAATFCSIVMPAKADITAATYNLMHANKKNGKDREAGNCEVIKQLKADIYGFQEAIKANNQLNSIEKILYDYKWFGKPRSSGKGKSFWHRAAMFLAPLNNRFMRLGAEDEYNPIFYNPETIELITNDTFGINGDGSGYLPRICTVGQFRDKTTNKEFYVYNTHLDNKEEKSRLMQINIITDDIAQRCGNKPVILMGDFNTTLTGETQNNLSAAGFTQGRQVAANTEGPITTHVSGKPFEVDHILIKPKQAFTIKMYKVLSTISKKTSDHNPVSMTFSLK